MVDDGEPSGCLGMILGLFGIRPATGRGVTAARLPYRMCDNFLTPAERSLFGVLCHVVGERGVVCPKVRVSDLLFVVDRRANQGHANRIDRKHVDFVICATGTITPRVVVELDDASHARRDRRERDELMDAAFAAAGLPLIHVVAQRQYAPAEIAALLLPHLATQGTASPAPPTVDVGSVPRCPNCGSEVVLRTASQGKSAGQRFYGCKSYPKCRSTIPVAD